jgi:hypothetical protein
MVKLRSAFFAAWSIVLAFTAISIVQPSAYALDYPMVSQMLLIDPAPTDASSALTLAGDQSPGTGTVADTPIREPHNGIAGRIPYGDLTRKQGNGICPQRSWRKSICPKRCANNL